MASDLDIARAATLKLSDKAREDLRHLPIVAIDPADARDHDDAWDGEIRDSRVTRITALHGFPVDFTVSNRCAIHTHQGPGINEH